MIPLDIRGIPLQNVVCDVERDDVPAYSCDMTTTDRAEGSHH